MTILFVITGILLLVSFIASKKKTLDGLKKGAMQFLKLLPTLLTVIILVSVALFFIPEKVLLTYFGDQAGMLGYLSAAIVGSVSLIPGFISFPLAGMLHESGVSYGVIALFITTLKMVGVMTIPVEAKYFGMKVTLIRNGLSFLGAIVIGVIMAIIFALT
ncbi:MAG: permease [Bacteroidales bacterium]|nr:permease [Bacteroidales bacterium]